MRGALEALGISSTIDVLIAGSAVMQAVLDEAWEASDMDMWATSHAGAAADLKHAGYALARHVPIDENSAYARMSATIRCIHEYRKAAGPVVQVITVKTENALDAVHAFDITACQVYYVPKQRVLAAASPDALAALLARRIVFSQSALQTQAPMEWIRTLKRVCKYVRRGFVIEDAQWTRMLAAVSERLGDDDEAALLRWVQSGNRHGQPAGLRFGYPPLKLVAHVPPAQLGITYPPAAAPAPAGAPPAHSTPAPPADPCRQIWE